MRLCPVCLGSAAINLGELSNTKIAPLARASYDLAHCRECDLVYLSPLPSERDLEILYVEELQFDYHTEESSRSVVDFAIGRLRAVLENIGVLDPPTVPEGDALKDAHLKKPLSVLEIGAGLAWTSRAAKAFSSDSLTVAQDVTSEVANKCPWVDRYIVGTADAPEIDKCGPYDVVSMTHVFEHLPDPIGILRRLRPITRGMVFLSAPHRPVKWDGSIESWRTYSYNHVPGHLQYFSERSLRRAADASGFALTYWDATSEDGQAFEAWLRPWTVEGLLAANAELDAAVAELRDQRVAMDAAVAELRDQRVAMERHIGTLESQLRMAAESRWVKLGNRFGLGPRLR